MNIKLTTFKIIVLHKRVICVNYKKLFIQIMHTKKKLVSKSKMLHDTQHTCKKDHIIPIFKSGVKVQNEKTT